MRLCAAGSRPDTEEFYRWQRPRELLNRCHLVSKAMSNQTFISAGKESEKTVQEAIVAANFALRLAALKVLVCAIRMTKRETPGIDFELMVRIAATFRCHQFEITTAYDEGRRIREDYRDGRESDIRFEVGPVNPEWVAPSIKNKTGKKFITSLSVGEEQI